MPDDERRPCLVKAWNGEQPWEGLFMGWQHEREDGLPKLMAVVQRGGENIVVDGLRVKFLEPQQ